MCVESGFRAGYMYIPSDSEHCGPDKGRRPRETEMRGASEEAVFILQLEILEEEHLGRKWGSVFPGLKADQCGLTTVSD